MDLVWKHLTLGLIPFFGYPGGSLPLCDAIYNFKGIRHILDAMSKVVCTKLKDMPNQLKVKVAVVTSGPEQQMPLQGLQMPWAIAVLFLRVRAGIGKDAFRSRHRGDYHAHYQIQLLLRETADIPRIITEVSISQRQVVQVLLWLTCPRMYQPRDRFHLFTRSTYQVVKSTFDPNDMQIKKILLNCQIRTVLLAGGGTMRKFGSSMNLLNVTKFQ